MIIHSRRLRPPNAFRFGSSLMPPFASRFGKEQVTKKRANVRLPQFPLQFAPIFADLSRFFFNVRNCESFNFNVARALDSPLIRVLNALICSLLRSATRCNVRTSRTTSQRTMQRAQLLAATQRMGFHFSRHRLPADSGLRIPNRAESRASLLGDSLIA